MMLRHLLYVISRVCRALLYEKEVDKFRFDGVKSDKRFHIQSAPIGFQGLAAVMWRGLFDIKCCHSHTIRIISKSLNNFE